MGATWNWPPLCPAKPGLRVGPVLDGECLETRPLFSRGQLRRMEPLRVGQARPHQVDGPAQPRIGFRLEAIGPCEAPVELVHGRPQCRHNPEGAVHPQLVRAVAATPGLRRSADVGGERGAVRFCLHGVAAGGGAERPVTRCDDRIPRKRRRLVVLGLVASA